MSLSSQLSYGFDFQNLCLRDKDRTGTSVQNGILLLAYILYIVLGAMIFGALEKDFEVQQRCLAVKTKADFLKNRSNMTREDVQRFVQVMTSIILSGIPPTGNRTAVSFWTFTNSFITCIVTLSTIGYGTIFPKTTGGQMFCVVFAAIGIPLTIILFKHVGMLVYLPFDKFGIYLQHKGINEKNAYLWKNLLFILIGSFFFLILPPFVFMSLENWSYIEGIYYSFNTISTIGFGDYTVGKS
uniref:Potassium channel domain-containing protein n=2 Tax=Sus scrofa TaxID=9823 RepID=A0A8D1GVS0_PIG